jgi:hypothetical protein
MKTIGQLRLSSDTPLAYLAQQGHAWESLRAAYWAKRNPTLAADATERAAFYEEQWKALPETAHRSQMPKSLR